MDKLHNENARAKGVETRKANLPQMSDPLERESTIVVDYAEKVLLVYTNHATVFNRLARKGYKHVQEELLDGEVYSRSYVIPFDDMPKIISSGIFK